MPTKKVKIDNRTTPSMLKAISKYDNTFDICSVRLPRGTKKRIAKTGKSANKYIKELVLWDLHKKGL